MDEGSLVFDGSGNVLIAPLAVMRPMAFPSSAVNHIAPSGPLVKPVGPASADGNANCPLVSSCGAGVAGVVVLPPLAPHPASTSATPKHKNRFMFYRIC